MSISAKHPKYEEILPDWLVMRDLAKGERHVKNQGVTYLPATEGMLLDGIASSTDVGYNAYQAYKMRARMPNYVKKAIEKLVGIMHQKNATFELPKVMEPLREKASINGESLIALLRRINVEQCHVGRIGLLTDISETPTTESVLPYIATYDAERIINWDEYSEADVNSLRMVVLDETTERRIDDFEWKIQEAYRVLMIGGESSPFAGKYATHLFVTESGNQQDYDTSLMKIPNIRGKDLDFIPFVFVNTKDVTALPEEPPLADLASLQLTIYRGEADYRQSLFMQGQDTLVIAGEMAMEPTNPGESQDVRVGTGARINLAMGGSAQYVGVSATGLSEQRTALENDRKEAEEESGTLISTHDQGESGVAMNTRITAKTATLNQIAMTGAFGLEIILKKIANWIGADETKVKVIPNMEFSDFNLGVTDIVGLMTARAAGAPISLETIHALMVERGITQFDFETEMALREEEASQALPEPPGKQDQIEEEKNSVGPIDPQDNLE